MTKETKIGLLVGLAFIILFAIILSEKSATSENPSLPIYAAADAAKKKPASTGSEQPLHNVGKLPVNKRFAPSARSTKKLIETAKMEEKPLGRLLPAEDEPLPALPESLVKLLNGPVQPQDGLLVERAASDRDNAPSMSVQDAVDLALLPETGKASIQKAKKPAENISESTRFADSAKSTRSKPTNGASETPGRVQSRETPPVVPAPPVVVIATHTVQPGESLGKIAARHYGRATPSRIQAIFDANRDTVESIDRIRAQDVVRIPKLDEDGTLFEPAPGFAAVDIAANRTRHANIAGPRIPLPVGDAARKVDSPRNSAPDDGRPIAVANADRASNVKPPFEWYEIREKDSLSRIAKRVLGSEKRFLELYRFNRDLIPDKNMLKPGEKIRIPLKSKVVGSLRTAISSAGPDSAEP